MDTETTGETEKERAGGDWLNGPPEGSFLFWCVAWWSRGCCGLSAVLRCGGAAPWSVWVLRVWVVSGVCERQVQSTTRVRSSGSEPRSNPTLKINRKFVWGGLDVDDGWDVGSLSGVCRGPPPPFRARSTEQVSYVCKAPSSYWAKRRPYGSRR